MSDARPARVVWRLARGVAILAFAASAVGCGGLVGTTAATRMDATDRSGAGTSPMPTTDGGVSVATNAGSTLVALALDPGAPGVNVVVVDLRDVSDKVVTAAVRLDLALDGVDVSSVTLPAAARRGTLRVPQSGHARVRVTILDGTSAGASAAFSLDLPVAAAADNALLDIDRAMQGLHSLRETQTLSAGGPTLRYQFAYLAPDSVRFTTLEPSGELLETRIIGRERFDRQAMGTWTRTDLGSAARVPVTGYAQGASRVRVVGRRREGGADLLEIAFVHRGGYYYRVWVGLDDHLVRQYSMFARGHFMTGEYSDYDAPVAISAP